MNKKQDLWIVALGINVGIILWLTILGRTSKVLGNPYFQPFHGFSSAVNNIKRDGLRGNFLGNIALFVPFGVLLPLVDDWFDKWKRTVLIGFVFSVTIEFVQYITCRGYFEIDDIILNLIGTGLGFVVFQLLRITSKGKLDTYGS
ncbi:MAG: VanZ family protein [Clostridiales bacterium]|nr:VanZ family protein [Clostridiales bacterium]